MKASRLAGKTSAPAYIRVANDQEMLEMALIENIQRQDLNAMEVAISYKRLMDECQLTHDALSERVGKNRSTVTNYIRLLKLSPTIQKAIKDKKISMGHARALVGVEDIMVQQEVFKRILEQELSVRATEALIRSYSKGGPAKARSASSLPNEYVHIQDKLTQHLGTKVSMKANKKGKGQIIIHFADTKHLNNILDKLEE